uniref:Hypothethical protein, Xanthine/uracil/vitamin C permease domain n=1 Tax=blood disease bacterium R229 TaxID=741978 RepID=G2ZXA4_9RALS|nr:hypothethical protein, Xanthine/uracil/vitamin C permease domain [blood disease bacterium R229]
MIVTLDHLRVKGAIPIGILTVTAASCFLAGNTFHGVVSMPPSIAPTLLPQDIQGALSVGILNVVLVFFLVERFDATGRLMGVANRAGPLQDGPPEQGAAGRQHRHRGRFDAGHVVDYGVYRKRRGCAGGRPHGADRADGGGAVSGLPVHCATGGRGAGLCDGAGLAVRILPDAARAGRPGLG